MRRAAIGNLSGTAVVEMGRSCRGMSLKRLFLHLAFVEGNEPQGAERLHSNY